MRNYNTSSVRNSFERIDSAVCANDYLVALAVLADSGFFVDKNLAEECMSVRNAYLEGTLCEITPSTSSYQALKSFCESIIERWMEAIEKVEADEDAIIEVDSVEPKSIRSFSQVICGKDELSQRATEALCSIEREFGMDLIFFDGSIRQHRREDEYVGKKLEKTDGLIKALADFCQQRVPECRFDFWKFRVEYYA